MKPAPATRLSPASGLPGPPPKGEMNPPARPTWFPSSRQSQGDAAWDTRDYANLPGPVANTRHTVFAGEPQQQDGHLPFDGDALRSS